MAPEVVAGSPLSNMRLDGGRQEGGVFGDPFLRAPLAFWPWAPPPALCWWLLSSVELAQVSTEQHLGREG